MGPNEEDGQSLDPATERLMRRLQTAENAWSGQETQGAWIAPEGGGLQSTALHSGAPLADTGPAETATVILLVGTIGWIVWRSKEMKQFLMQ